MKKLLPTVIVLMFTATLLQAQKVSYEEYDLENGLHVILHQDRAAPIVITSVMYHVGGKDRSEGRTGFAHFFEHLLFEGSKNIGRGQWFKIVASNGGQVNANTSQDRTYYYEIFPSNKLELGLWMESERMLHPVIEQQGVDTQNEVVKEERRLSYDNAPYGQLLFRVSENLFRAHPYKDPNIGYMKDLDAASLEEFLEYNEAYYAPNNAVLVVAGDIDPEKTRRLIKDYFGPIQAGDPVVRNYPVEDPINQTINATAIDPNIQVPATVLAYRTPGFRERDAYALEMISSYLSDGKSSKLYRKMVDEQKQALQVGAFNIGQEDYGIYLVYSLPVGATELDLLAVEMEEEITKVREALISERDYQKLQNTFENQFVNANSSIAGIAGSLASFYLLYGDTGLINNQIDIYRSITREEIREVAKKYLNPSQRLELKYLPEESIQN
jgi:predicted Zn-dependent peptidase